MEVLVCENRCFPFTELLTIGGIPPIINYTITKVYKLHESKQVEDITTMLKIEGIKHNVFEYEEYTAIEVTGTPLEIIRASTIYQTVTTLKL